VSCLEFMSCSLSNLLAREHGGKEVISEENARLNLKRGEQKSKLFCLIGLQSYDLHSGIASPFETKGMTHVITWEESKNVSKTSDREEVERHPNMLKRDGSRGSKRCEQKSGMCHIAIYSYLRTKCDVPELELASCATNHVTAITAMCLLIVL
jgi:hypothetical protein